MFSENRWMYQRHQPVGLDLEESEAFLECLNNMPDWMSAYEFLEERWGYETLA